MTMKLKRSSVAGKKPVTTDLELGQLAMNTNDGKVFGKKSVSGAESVFEVGAPQVGTVRFFDSDPGDPSWLKTGGYYSKSTYPALAAKYGTITDIGSMLTTNQTNFVTASYSGTNSSSRKTWATNPSGTVGVVGGVSSIVNYTTDGGATWNAANFPAISACNPLFIDWVNGQFILGGTTGGIATSPDGINWTMQPAPSNSWGVISICHNGSMYVAAGLSSNQYAYSTNLKNWTLSAVISGAFIHMIYANSLFVAITNSTIYTSSDGITFTSRQGGFIPVNLYYINNTFVVVGNSGTCYYSTDGITWTAWNSGLNSGDNMRAVSFGNGVWVATSSNAFYYASSVGGAWTRVLPAQTGMSLWDIQFTNGKFYVADTASQGVCYISTDGSSWTVKTHISFTFQNQGSSIAVFGNNPILLGQSVCYNIETGATVMWSDPTYWANVWQTSQASSQNAWSPIGYNGSVWVAIGGTGGRLLTSSDASTWTPVEYFPVGAAATIGSGVHVVNNRFIIAVSASAMITSADGTNWTSVTTSSSQMWAAYGNGRYVTVGQSGWVAWSSDFTNWTNVSTGAVSLNCVTFANGLFVAVGNGGTIFTSPDGATWTSRTSNTSSSLTFVTYANALFVAVGVSGTILTSSDGTTWSSATSNTTFQLTHVAYGAGLFVAVGFSGAIQTSPDGITWTSRRLLANPDPSTIARIIWNGESFFASISGYAAIIRSTDGINWYRGTNFANTLSNGGAICYEGGKTFHWGAYTYGYLDADNRTWRAMAFVAQAPNVWPPNAASKAWTINNRFFLFQNGRIFTSTDAQTWTVADVINSGGQFFAGICFDGNYYYLGLSGNSAATGVHIFRSTNGINWSYWSETLNRFHSSVPNIRDLVYANGRFVLLTTSQTNSGNIPNLWSSTDAINWTPSSSNYQLQDLIANNYLATDGSTVLASANTPGHLLRSTDGGQSFSAVFESSGSMSPVYLGNGIWQYGQYYSTDTLNWTYMGAGPLTSQTQTIQASFSDGNYFYLKMTADGKWMMGNKNGSGVATLVRSTIPLNSDTVQGMQPFVTSTKLFFANTNYQAFRRRTALTVFDRYSYNTSTTFWVPPVHNASNAIAYVYAGA